MRALLRLLALGREVRTKGKIHPQRVAAVQRKNNSQELLLETKRSESKEVPQDESGDATKINKPHYQGDDVFPLD